MVVIESIFSFIVAISILVTIHEFGHFIVAKAVGVKVLRFSIGFGRPVWRKQLSPEGTEFQVAMLPLGGYVKMYGEQVDAVPEEMRQYSFSHKSLLARAAVVSAGPFFNFLFAIVAYWFVFVAGVVGMKPIIGEVEPGSVAAEAGIRSQDQIVAVSNQEVFTWEQVLTLIVDDMLDSDVIRISVLSEANERRTVELPVGEQIKLDSMDKLITTLGFAPYMPPIEPRIGTILPDGAAKEAGLKPNDLILSVNGVGVPSWSKWVEMIRQGPGQSMELLVQREERQFSLVVTPRLTHEDGEAVGKIGAGVKLPTSLDDELMVKTQFSPLDAVSKSLDKTWEMISLTVRLMFKMVIGEVSVKNLSGPVSIAQYAGYSAADGILSFLSFLAIVSISLGVLNLLPVPILDGGHLLYYGIEFVTGRPISPRMQAVGFQIGIALLLFVTLLAFYNDLMRLFK